MTKSQKVVAMFVGVGARGNSCFAWRAPGCTMAPDHDSHQFPPFTINTHCNIYVYTLLWSTPTAQR